MRMVSAPVLGAAALVTSPVLYEGVVLGIVPIDLALTRFLVAVVLCWLGLSVVEALVGDPPRRVVVPSPEEPAEETPQSG